MKKGLLVFSLIFITELILVSCNLFCPCDCNSGPQKQIDILSWNIQTIADNYQSVNSSTVLPYDQVYKSFYIDQRNLVYNESMSLDSHYNAAHACSPSPMKAIQTFKSIRMISASEATYLDSNDVIVMGDDITDRFLMSFFFDKNFKPIDDFIDQLIIYEEHSYRLRLKDKPFRPITLKFDFIITMSDGKVYQFKNEQLMVD